MTAKEIEDLREEVSRLEEDLAEKKVRLAVLSKEGFLQNGIRDPANPCRWFVAGKPSGGCETDGHYLCDECQDRASCRVCGLRPMYCECCHTCQTKKDECVCGSM